LSTPVILWQLWGFISPGLYPTERRNSGPFVVFGTLAFLAGTSFCYFALLPSMFQFLLQEGDSGALVSRLDTARQKEQEAIRFVRLGDVDRAGDLAKSAEAQLLAEGDGQVNDKDVRPDPKVETPLQFDGLGRLLDATLEGVGPAAKPAVRKVLDQRLLALDAASKGNFDAATQFLEEAAGTLATSAPGHSGAVTSLWSLEKSLALGKSRYAAQTWTRPMLTMSEQLSLVLLLELAFGVIFELPVVMALLAALGIVEAKFLMKYQRHAFVVCLILAAVITPTGDAINLALMTVPMFLCFEVGVLAVWLIERRRRKAAASTAITPTG
jgi:sec-independent protein translocase protein TatC